MKFYWNTATLSVDYGCFLTIIEEVSGSDKDHLAWKFPYIY